MSEKPTPQDAARLLFHLQRGADEMKHRPVEGGALAPRMAQLRAWQTALDPTLLQWAAGLGLRYQTPFGPLRIDVGVRLPERLSGSFPASRLKSAR